ncbi:MAG: DUF1570 domain-containing protein [Lentisphaeria bacterium]|nr:DUF1570 domain-containing protein [Lentisphaeria bacterium]
MKKYYLIFCQFFIWFGVIGETFAQSYSLGGVQYLQKSDLQVRTFKDFKRILPSPINKYNLTSERTGKVTPAIRVTEKSIADQVALILDSPSLKIRLFEMKYIFPLDGWKVADQDIVSLSEYDERKPDFDRTWTQEWEKAWLVQNLFINLQAMENPLKLKFKKTAVRYYQQINHLQGKRIFCLTLKSKRNIAVEFQFKDQSISLSTQGKLCTSFINNIVERRIRDRSKELKVIKRRSDRSDAFNAKREQVIQGISNMSNWWFVETDNFIIKSDLRKSDALWITKKLVPAIEVLFEKYKQFIPPIKKFDDVCVITVFNRWEDYKSYVPEGWDWTIGLWMANREELIISQPEEQRRSDRQDQLIETAFHEIFHQYIFYALDRKTLPIWFNEGHAQLFEDISLSIRYKKVKVNEHEQRAKLLEFYLYEQGKRPNFAQLLSLSHKQFYETDRQFNYVMSWALVYFLRKGTRYFQNKGYEKVCTRLIDYIKENPKSSSLEIEATKYAFEGINMDQLNRDFIKFWRKNSKYRRAAEKSPLNR